MTVRTYVKSVLMAGLVTSALGGFLLHTRIHPVTHNWANLIPLLSGIIGVLVIPLLFGNRRTLHWGYVLNGFTAIIGTVVMAHFSLVHWPKPLTLETFFLNTLLADIMILWGKFFIGKALFDLELFGYDAEHQKKGVWWRYPNLGWLAIHLIAVSAVYAAGNILWR
jgi:hypothetical protein